MAELRYYIARLEVEVRDGATYRYAPIAKARPWHTTRPAIECATMPLGKLDIALLRVFAETAVHDAFAAQAVEIPYGRQLGSAALSAATDALTGVEVPRLSALMDGREALREIGRTAMFAQRCYGEFNAAPSQVTRAQMPRLGARYAGLRDVARAQDRLVEAATLWNDEPMYVGGVDLGDPLPLRGGALPFSDTFTNSNGTALTSHNAVWEVNNGAWTIQTNAAEPPANSQETGISVEDAAWGNDHYAQATLVSSSSAEYVGGVGVRMAQGGTHTYYHLYGLPGDLLYLGEVIAGSQTTLDTGTAPAQNDVIRFEASGTTLSPFIDGVAHGMGTTTDNSLATGRGGLTAWRNNPGTAPRLDSFEGGNIGAAGGGVTPRMALLGVG